MTCVLHLLRVILFAIYVLLAQQTFAQKQGDLWLFGEHCGLSFVTDTLPTEAPLFVGGGHTASTATNIQQGCSSICDNYGNLLFYTNGQTIWTRFNQPMYNGDSLLGNISSTQSSLIVPQPGCSNYYYVFTTDAYTSLVNGFRYSLVDMCYDDGRGEVVADKKNILLQDTMTEKLCAMMTADSNYWILVHKLFSNEFCAYRLTANGVGDTVVSRIGSVEGDSAITNGASEAVGQMKFSPDGTKVAVVVGNRLPGMVEVFNFNQLTGKLSNYISAPITRTTGSAYGVEFSPNSALLYASAGDTMVQFNLLSGGGNNDSVIASVKLISRVAQTNLTWGLQLAPDNKIYVCQGDTALGVINSPNSTGASCNFVANQLSLNGHLDQLTLPGFVAGYHYGNFAPDCNFLSTSHLVINAACSGESGSAEELASGGTAPVTIRWNTNPPQYGPQANNLAPGTYVAIVSGSAPCTGPVTLYDTVIINKGSAGLAFPNAFTPGSHDINSVFIPHIDCTDNNLNYLLRIYNRWGQLLFETQNPTQGWDGTFNGKPEEVGVYDYYVEFTCGNCNEVKKGNVTLLR